MTRVRRRTLLAEVDGGDFDPDWLAAQGSACKPLSPCKLYLREGEYLIETVDAAGAKVLIGATGIPEGKSTVLLVTANIGALVDGQPTTSGFAETLEVPRASVPEPTDALTPQPAGPWIALGVSATMIAIAAFGAMTD